MEILIATGLYPPDIGGPATYTALLEEELPERGIEVSVLLFSSVRHLPPGIRHIVYFLRCIYMARGADAIYAQDTVSVGFPSALAAKVMRKKFLVRVPGDYAWEQGKQRLDVVDELDEFQNKTYGLRVAILRSIQKFVVHQAVLVIVPSVYMQKIVAGWGVKPTVLYSSITMPVAYVLPDNRPGGFLICTVARLVPWKGIDRLISALTTHPDWKLAIVGDGPQRQKLQMLAQNSALEGRIVFTGKLPHEEAMGWVKTADVFVLNSTYEGLSHLLVEAMALGTPIVATDVGGNPELVHNGKTGLLVPVQNEKKLSAAISDIQKNPEKTKKRAMKAQQRAQEFRIDIAIEKLCTLLKTI